MHEGKHDGTYYSRQPIAVRTRTRSAICLCSAESQSTSTTGRHMRACCTQSLSVITRQCPPRQKKWAIPYCRKLYQSGPFHSLYNSIKVGDSILYKILSKWAILYCTDFYQSGLFHTVQILSKWVIPYRTKFYQRQ